MFPVLVAAMASGCDPEPKAETPPADEGITVIDECVDDGDTEKGCK